MEKELRPRTTVKKESYRTITVITTNFLMIAGGGAEVICEQAKHMQDKFHILRMSFFNVSAPDIDNTKGEYAYDENYNSLKNSIANIGARSKATPAMLCQFTTGWLLTTNDLRELQDKDNSLTIINRWHTKHFDSESGEPFMEPQTQFIARYKDAGYFSLTGLEVNRCEFLSDQEDKNRFLIENGIDTFAKCPECGNLTPVCELRERGGTCYGCLDETKDLERKIFGSFKDYVQGKKNGGN